MKSTPEQTTPKTNLFQTGFFKLHSGSTSNWKICCENLTTDDWDTLALMASEILPSFGSVEGVPTGGLKFADALRKYQTTGPLLICDDVLTTGDSINKQRADRPAYGIVVFSRTPYFFTFGWIWVLMQMNGDTRRLGLST
jgi:hypothetical protein